jgi:hypothetical protein
MKITPSALVAKLANRAGGAVAASWRGTNYARSYNPSPKNPKSTKQKLARASLKYLVKFHHYMAAGLKAAWNTAALSQPFSGFNFFTGSNAVAQKAAFMSTLTPSNPKVNPVATLTCVPGAAGHATVAWTVGGATGTDKAAIYIYENYHPTDPTVFDEQKCRAQNSDEATDISVGTKDMAGLTSGTTVRAMLAAKNPTNGYSIALQSADCLVV